MPTPITNQIPASAEPIAVTLTDGTKISSERAVRWLDLKTGKLTYQVEVDGKQFLGFATKSGKVRLL